jgi:cobalt-zinc-cadmium efflux system membrane fusion protein
MKNTMIIFLTIALTNWAPQLSVADESEKHKQDAHDDHDNEHRHNEHSHNEHSHNESHDDDAHNKDVHDEENTTTINDSLAKNVGITTAVAGTQSLHQTITTFGRLVTGPEQTSHVRARFPGVIKSVNVSIGDTVKTGALLAVIESNESLKKYEVRAPITGTITQRHANTGEMTQNQVLFSIANFDTLWAELRVYPSQNNSLKVGQAVHIITGTQELKSAISHIIPTVDDTPYLIARAKVDGSGSRLFPGLMVEGRVLISEFETPSAVKNDGLQTMGSEIGVFVKNNNEYIFTPLVIGRADDEFTEVLSGIEKGTQYVTENSYLIKADIEKSEAEHEH